MGGHVESLEAFFECYDPAKLGSSETLLARYAGKEAAFFRGLDKKYNCGFFAVRSQIVALLEEHDPPKAAGVDRLLASKPKKEEAVLAALKKKYAVSDAAPAAAAAAAAPSPKPAAAAARAGSAPAGDGSPEVFLKSIQTFFKLHDAASLAKAGAFAEKFGGRQRDFYTSLGKKYGKTHFETRDELVAIARGAGDRAFDADALMLAKLAGGTTSEQQLIAAVRKKYGHATVSSAAASHTSLPSTAAPAPTHKQRVAALFRAYAPDKAGGVDALLAKHAGNEEKLVAALVAKFGPEPAPQPAAAAGTVAVAQGPVDWAARITEFYRNYEPAKAAQAPALAAKYKGKEVALWTQLVRKYGPEPHWVERLERVVSESGTPVNRSNIIEKLVEFAGREDALHKIYAERYGAPSAAAATAASVAAPETIPHAARVYRMYYQYNKEKLGTVPDLLAKYKGKEADLYAAMLQKYGSDAMGGPTRETDYECRMVNLYAVHNADKLNAVPSLLAKYKGREPALIDGVKEKYGVTAEAGLQTAQQPAGGGASGVRTPSPLSYEQRMRNLYEKYNPDKVRTIPQALAKYRGHEEELMQALVERYGPEPPVQRTRTKEEVRQVKVGVIKEYYRRHKPYEYNMVPKVLAEWRGREDELTDVLRKEFGEVAEEEEGAAAVEGETEAEARGRRARELDEEFPKLRRLRQDDGYCSTVAKQVVALLRAPPAQVLGREEAAYAAVFDFLHGERTGRWRLEEEAAEAARDVAQRGDDAGYAARQREIHRLLEERSTSEHLRLAFRRWVAFLAGRLRCTAEVRDSLMSQKMSVYDQMQTNRYSIAAFERAEKTKTQRAVRSQSPQPAAAPPRRRLRAASPVSKQQPRHHAQPRQTMARSAAEIRLEAQDRRRTQQENMAIMRESKRLDDAERLRRSPRAVRSSGGGGQRLPQQQPRRRPPQSPGSPRTPRRGLQEQQQCYDEAQRDRVGEAYASVALQYANPDAVLYAETLQLLTGTPETAVESEMRRRREAAAGAASPEALAPPVMLSPGAREI